VNGRANNFGHTLLAEIFLPKGVSASRVGLNGLQTPFPGTQWHTHILQVVVLQAKVDSLKALQAKSAAGLDALLPSILDKAFKGEL
jgi:hypothetical protein